MDSVFQYRSSVDPGAVGAGRYWLDTTSEPYALKRRNEANSAWVGIGIEPATTEAIQDIVGDMFDAVAPLNAAYDDGAGLVTLEHTGNHDDRYYTEAETDAALALKSSNLGEAWFEAPGPARIATVDTTALTTGQTLARLLGQCPMDCSQVVIKCRVLTAVASITWAEVAIAVAPSTSSNLLTLVGDEEDVSAVFNTTGAKTVTVDAPVPAGSIVYALFGSQATTPFQLMATLPDNVQAGFVRQATARPSTMAADTSFAVSGLVNYAAYVVAGYVT